MVKGTYESSLNTYFHNLEYVISENINIHTFVSFIHLFPQSVEAMEAQELEGGRTMALQAGFQLLGLAVALFIAISSGALTGIISIMINFQISGDFIYIYIYIYIYTYIFTLFQDLF